MAFQPEAKTTGDFSKITISLASPDYILEQSRGEVTKPETINYRTFKPERDGLFCERIFGPVKDWQCACGKYKGIRYKGIVCDRCGVEVTEKKVRRERTGHIMLTVPVAHIWYFRSLPNKIGLLLGLPTKKLEAIIYYEKYVVIQPGVKEGEINTLDFLSEEEYYQVLDTLPKENQYLDDNDPTKFIAKMGGDALYDLLSRVNFETLSKQLESQSNDTKSQQRRQEALKRLQVVESFKDANSRTDNRPEWMVIKVIPIIPPDLRPLVPLDGGRFATSDLNDLYRRVIIRNNRLKRLIEIKAPEVILRNEKRMLQEAVDALFDNSRKSSAVKTDSNRALKSLSDSLKGKQGRFRQNLLGKRVDYSARSVIVVGPDLQLHECGLPKDMAAELFKPFIIRKLVQRGLVKTVKSAKKMVDRRESVIWEILESVLKGHPVLLNRAPTLHRLGIQAFQPKLIEGKAIQLHPLACTAFNADFDGDQMAVHVPLGNTAILEAQILMLGAHNIINPANGAPIAVPSQDMVLGLYYITKERKNSSEHEVKGEGMVFYSPQEVIIAYNERKVDLHAGIKVKVNVRQSDGSLQNTLIETTVGRVLFNQVVPKEYGYINQLLTKKSLRDIIGDIFKKTNLSVAAKFLDDIKEIGFSMAFRGGLSFLIDDLVIPEEKAMLIESAQEQVEEVWSNYNMGFITNTERYNKIIDIWTSTNISLTQIVMKQISEDKQGFNPVYMMLHSGARGSQEQIRQLCGMRGLMAKPQKSGDTGGEIIENPILSNFKEGLSILEYFISTHGARKGLADTALKTADAGYLTRRLVDVAQDVIINEVDCGTLRGLSMSALKVNDEVKETLYERILGRVALEDVIHPNTGEIIISAAQEIDEELAAKVENSPIETVEIRSVLTCEAKRGVCAKCYGRNLATGRMVQRGEAAGVIAAQSIGEPGTQLTLRTFHVGGVAGGSSAANRLVAKYDGILQIEELRTVESTNESTGDKETIVIGRTAEMRLIDANTGMVLTTGTIPYGSKLKAIDGAKVSKGDIICEWDPWNAVIISEFDGKVAFENIIEGLTFREELDEQTGFVEKVIIDRRDKTRNPTIKIKSKKGEVLREYSLPTSAHIMVNDGDQLKAGAILVKIPRQGGKTGDITGGLPRVTELFEARNPSNPAVVSEVDGLVSFGGIKRGNREIFIQPKSGEQKTYLVSLTKHILVQENDYVKAGQPLTDGAVTPSDILAIKGPTAVQEYLVNEIQEVYRTQGVKINDKHFEVIVRQMMKKVEIIDRGDTTLLENSLVNKMEFQQKNDAIYGMKKVVDPGDSSDFLADNLISTRQLRDENSSLKRKGLRIIEVIDAQAATSRPVLQGITRASLQTDSWISAASFQETTKVLNEAAVSAKVDFLDGLKENVIVGHLIPAGTGLKEYRGSVVYNQDDFDNLKSANTEEQDLARNKSNSMV